MTSDRASPPSRNVADQIASTLRSEIAEGSWAVGQMLPAEHQLMERFGVSRPSCREALRILQSEGLLEIQRGNKGGARVIPPDPGRIALFAGVFLQMRNATITEVFETRMTIEPAAVRSFAKYGDREILSQLAQNAASQRFIVHDRPTFYRRGRAFRELLVRNCGSESLRLLCLVIGEIADMQLSKLSLALPQDPEQGSRFLAAIRMKEDMIALIEAGDGDAAADIWYAYLRQYLDRLHEINSLEVGVRTPLQLA
ncbi:MAG: GntR family transcriptional regulator [Sphingobium sp.]